MTRSSEPLGEPTPLVPDPKLALARRALEGALFQEAPVKQRQRAKPASFPPAARPPLTPEQAGLADEHMRFALNTVEVVLCGLGSVLSTAALYRGAQPETLAALKEAERVINAAYGTVREQRDLANRALLRRALESP